MYILYMYIRYLCSYELQKTKWQIPAKRTFAKLPREKKRENCFRDCSPVQVSDLYVQILHSEDDMNKNRNSCFCDTQNPVNGCLRAWVWWLSLSPGIPEMKWPLLLRRLQKTTNYCVMVPISAISSQKLPPSKTLTVGNFQFLRGCTRPSRTRGVSMVWCGSSFLNV